MVSLFLRSLVFNFLSYLSFVLLAVIALPTFLLPRAAMVGLAGWWAQINILLLRVICNVRVDGARLREAT